MSHIAYRQGLLNLAQNEANGEDIEDDINRLAAAAKIDPATVRAEVTEMADLSK